MAKNEIIAYHGWGFDAGCWHSWKEFIPEAWHWINFDKGYFGDSRSPHFSEKPGKKVVVTHSFGLHQCPDDILTKADLLVIISGFLAFHPKATQFRRRSKQVVDDMINQFKEQPYQVLRAFYRNVFHPEKSYELPPDEMNQPILLDDLKWLNRASRKLPTLKNSANMYIFQGEEDAIVPKRKGRALFEQYSERAKYFEVKAAGHALPMTHAEKCWDIIKDEL